MEWRNFVMSIARNRKLIGMLALGAALSLILLALWPSGDRAGGARAETNPQAEALSDGHVTWEEYESAIWRAFECVRAAGGEPMAAPHLNAAGTSLTYSFFSDESGASDVAIPCMEEHSMHVEQIWAGQNQPSAETLAAAETAMKECLVTGGYEQSEVADAPSFTVLQGRADSGTFSACVRRVSIDYKVGWWAGD
jgi:hypothetical protein